jgi:hypothetical protein
MTLVFRRADVRNASGHRLRARFLNLLVEGLLDEYQRSGQVVADETILLIAAEAAGQSNPQSLRPYLDLARRKTLRKLSGQETTDPRKGDGLCKLAASKVLQSLISALEKGDQAEVRECIEALKNLTT